MYKEERLSMDYESGSCIQENVKANSRVAYANRTYRKEELIIYLAAAREAVSAVLMTDREAKQMPIYFISRALQ
nr:reverse transcriptase domain-containing protein [Tanacetum cinerariifolium]